MAEIVDHSAEIERELKRRIGLALEACGLTAEGYAKLNLTEKGRWTQATFVTASRIRQTGKRRCISEPTCTMLPISNMVQAAIQPSVASRPFKALWHAHISNQPLQIIKKNTVRFSALLST